MTAVERMNRYPGLSEYEAIDAEIAEQTLCPRCGGKCHYAAIRDGRSRIVLAVCDIVQCGGEVAI